MKSTPDLQHRLPPGQTLTRKWPIVGEKVSEPPKMDLTQWHLKVSHADSERTFSYQELFDMPSEELNTDIHCVTGWTRLDASFQGCRFTDFLKHFGITIPASTCFVRFEAFSSRKHDTTLPLDLALKEAWLIHSFEGEPLTPQHGFPLRVVMPSRYFYKSLKWLKWIQFMDTDCLGFWERTTGYHNEADPWKEQRLDAKRFSSSEECKRFRNQANFDAYRSEGGSPKVIVQADLSKWNPMTPDLHGLHLKACDFRHAQLKGVNLRQANLTFGRFQGATLEGADLTGADLEGCDFTGANLEGAILHDCCMSATRFLNEENGVGLMKWDRLEVRSPDGLLENQEAYLRRLSVLKEAR